MTLPLRKEGLLVWQFFSYGRIPRFHNGIIVCWEHSDSGKYLSVVKEES